MKQLLITILLILSFSAVAQNNRATIKEKATELATATINSDWGVVIEYTYPKIVEMMGGEEAMKSVMVSAVQEQQYKFVSVDIGKLGKIYSGAENHLFSLVPQTVVLQMPNGKIQSESYLLAVSENEGQQWYFIDTAQLTMENVQEMLPNYNMELVIPPKKQPVFLGN